MTKPATPLDDPRFDSTVRQWEANSLLMRESLDELKGRILNQSLDDATEQTGGIVDRPAEYFEAAAQSVERQRRNFLSAIGAKDVGGPVASAAAQGTGRGVWKAPWSGPHGEIVLIAITSEHQLLGAPQTVPDGADPRVSVDALWQLLDEIDPVASDEQDHGMGEARSS